MEKRTNLQMNISKVKRTQAERVYLVMHAATGFANALMFTTYALYYVNELGLDPLQLLLVGTFLELYGPIWR